jgi:hypothetical protein
MKTITLDCPIQRGEMTITEVRFLHPQGSGWLRGVKLFDLMQMDTTALIAVLPRITDPALTEHEINTALHPADFVQLGAEVAGFLATRSQKREAGIPSP